MADPQLMNCTWLFAWVHAVLALIPKSAFLLHGFPSLEFNKIYSCDGKVWGSAHVPPLV